MVRRFAMLAFSLSLTLALTGSHLVAQDAKKDEQKKEAPKAEVPKTEAPKTEAPKAEAPKNEPKKEEAAKKTEPPKEESPLPIPPEVEQKLQAARRAVAEAIVAAQDAGLVKTSIEPPPILDILLTGRATDDTELKARKGVSPEVFGAWFTGFGKKELEKTVTPQTDVRIINPSSGLKTWYELRASILNREIEAVRKAKGTAAKPKEEPKKDEVKKDEVKKDDAGSKAAEKKDEPKK